MLGKSLEGDAGDNCNSTYHTNTAKEATACVAVHTAVSTKDKDLALGERSVSILKGVACSSNACDTCTVSSIEVLTTGYTVVNTNNLTVLVNDECLSPTVIPGKLGILSLEGIGINNEVVGTESRLSLVDSDSTAKNLDGLFANNYGYAVTLCCANLVITLGGALCTYFTNVLTVVNVALALVSASCICAICIEAETALYTNALTLVSEGNAGDSHLSADGTVVKEEGTGYVAVTVRSNDKVLALLKGIVSLGKVACCSTLGCIGNTAGIIKVIILTVCTVVDTNDLTVLVENECLTPAVAPAKLAGILGSIDYEYQLLKSVDILVD